MPHADPPTCSMGLIQTRRLLVTALVGLPSLLSAFLSFPCPGGPPTHSHSAGTNQSSPFLSSELLPCMSVWSEPEKLPFPSERLYSSTFCFSNFVRTFVSVFVWTPFDEGLCSHGCSTGPAAGQASCCSSNSPVLDGDVGRIKLVIFQAWSVLGRYAIRERQEVKKEKSKVEWKKKTEALLFGVFGPQLNVLGLFPLKVCVSFIPP